MLDYSSPLTGFYICVYIQQPANKIEKAITRLLCSLASKSPTLLLNSEPKGLSTTTHQPCLLPAQTSSVNQNNCIKKIPREIDWRTILHFMSGTVKNSLMSQGTTMVEHQIHG